MSMKAMSLYGARLPALVALSLLGVAGAACAGDADLLKCRLLADIGARVACYDAIPVGAGAGAAPVPATAAVSVPAAAVAPARTAEQDFGLEQVKKAEAAPKSIDSTIPGSFAGWGPTTRFKLANGQVWRVVDNSSADLMPMTNPKVKIVRNVIGTMFLEIEGTNNSPKVRRVE